jgi:glycerophosphoryl diester phosphodiesterase
MSDQAIALPLLATDIAARNEVAFAGPDRPVAIAHRAGNDLGRLRLAEELGVDFVETDVWLYRGRLEVRHEKTAGRLPVLWDRWSVAAGWGARLSLADVVQAARPETVLLLDLKGQEWRLPDRVFEVLKEHAPNRPFAVSSQNWDLLDAFRSHPRATVFYSVGNRRQLRALSGRLDFAGRHAVSIHARLLDPETVNALKLRASAVVPWRVDTPAQMQRLLAWGVDGINADELHLLRMLLTEHK